MSFKTAMFDSGKIGTILSNSGNKKRNYRFNIIASVTFRINWVLKTMVKFMLSQVTQTKSNSCDIFDCNRVHYIGSIIVNGKKTN